MISLERVSFSYGKQKILTDVSLAVPERSIFGFAGPNGAGKTTTIKLILGLITPDTGTIRLSGLDLAHHRKDVLSRIGSLVETPSLYPHLTAEENLEISRRIYGTEKSSIDRVLTSTGILSAKKKKVNEFSLGMKQRLGIALALLHSPSILILDEPINGLDPEGIQEFREFLKNLVKTDGVTILLSSHILSELEQIITHAGIISAGKIRFQGTLDELKLKQNGKLLIQVSDPEKAISILTEKGFIPDQPENNWLSLPVTGKQEAADLNALLVAGSVSVYQLKPEQPNLESVFFDLIQREVTE